MSQIGSCSTPTLLPSMNYALEAHSAMNNLLESGNAGGSSSSVSAHLQQLNASTSSQQDPLQQLPHPHHNHHHHHQTSPASSSSSSHHHTGRSLFLSGNDLQLMHHSPARATLTMSSSSTGAGGCPTPGSEEGGVAVAGGPEDAMSPSSLQQVGGCIRSTGQQQQPNAPGPQSFLGNYYVLTPEESFQLNASAGSGATVTGVMGSTGTGGNSTGSATDSGNGAEAGGRVVADENLNQELDFSTAHHLVNVIKMEPGLIHSQQHQSAQPTSNNQQSTQSTNGVNSHLTSNQGQHHHHHHHHQQQQSMGNHRPDSPSKNPFNSPNPYSAYELQLGQLGQLLPAVVAAQATGGVVTSAGGHLSLQPQLITSPPHSVIVEAHQAALLGKQGADAVVYSELTMMGTGGALGNNSLGLPPSKRARRMQQFASSGLQATSTPTTLLIDAITTTAHHPHPHHHHHSHQPEDGQQTLNNTHSCHHLLSPVSLGATTATLSIPTSSSSSNAAAGTLQPLQLLPSDLNSFYSEMQSWDDFPIIPQFNI